MKLVIITIALDAMPFVAGILPVLNRLDLDWHWYVCEGTAANVKDTSWCQFIQPRLSNDGTHEYLQEIKGGRVTHFQAPSWPGKTAMFNHVLCQLKEPCILLQQDADEAWLPHQLELIFEYVMKTAATRMDFRCRYFVGKDIVITSREGYGNHSEYEWRRVWKFAPGMKFETHEPPKIRGDERKVITQRETEDLGLVMDHYAYAMRSQVMFKEQYYGYANAVRHWERLQANTVWPVTDLKSFLPWVGDGVTADKLYK